MLPGLTARRSGKSLPVLLKLSSCDLIYKKLLNIKYFCEAICLECTVGSRQAEQGSRESMEEDDMVIRVGSSLEGRDEPMGRTRGL